MSDLTELYREIILDHNKAPKNKGPLEGCTNSAKGHNPLCGDEVVIHLKLAGDVIEDISFEGVGCAISTASASLLTEELKGKTKQQALDIFKKFQEMVTRTEGETSYDELGSLQALAGVREHPVRIKCATLAWHTFKSALSEDPGQVTTE